MSEQKSEKFLRVEDVMEMFTVSKITVYTWIREGKLAATRIGGRFYISRESLDKTIADGRVKSE